MKSVKFPCAPATSSVNCRLRSCNSKVDLVKLVRNLDFDDPSLRGGAVAIGNFDGVHRGHARIIEKLKERSAQNAGGSPSFYLAMIYSVMGEIDQAFDWLEKSYEDHEVEMYWLKVEPPFEPIRGDPRYQEMLDRVGFPEQ